MKYILSDIIKLITENIKALIISAFIFSLIVTGVFFFIDNDSEENNFLTEDEGTLEENTAVFRFYVENEDGTVFINSSLIEEYFILPEVVERAERATSTDIAPVLEEEIGSEFQKSQYERGVLGVERNGSTQIFKMNATIGSKMENLKIAEFYFDLLNSDEIEFLQNKNIFVIEEPYIASEKIYDEEVYDSYNEDEVTNYENEEDEPVNSLQNIVRYSVTLFLTFVLGGLIFIVYLVLKNIWKKAITHTFTYFKLPNDNLIKINKSNESEFIHDEFSENPTKYLIVSQNGNLKYLSNFKVINSLKDNQDLITDKEIIIRIEENLTSKEWYKEQREILRKYPFNVTLLHLSD